jgi:molecular chaperone GrpE (heat shock protein)
MWKFVGALMLVVGAFALGYYFGQRPVGTLQDTIGDLQRSLKDMSRNVVDTTMGIERDLRRRQALLDTKSRVVQAKAELVDKNYGEAAKQLAEGVDALESALKGAKPNEQTQAVRGFVGQLQEMRLELTMGKPVPLRKLTELQQNLDRELNR